MCHQGTPWFRANRRSGTGNKQPLLKRWLQERPRMNGKPGFAKQRRAQNQGERQNKKNSGTLGGEGDAPETCSSSLEEGGRGPPGRERAAPTTPKRITKSAYIREGKRVI